MNAGQNTPPLDLDVLRELRRSLGDQPGTIAAIYRRFLVNAAIHIGDLRSQSNAQRASTLHTLKGSAAMVGARRIAELAGRLQPLFHENPNHPAEDAIRDLENELTTFRSALAAHVDAQREPGASR